MSSRFDTSYFIHADVRLHISMTHRIARYKPNLVISSSWIEFVLYDPYFMFELAILGAFLYVGCKVAFVTSKKAACGNSSIP